ncbi:SDR family NAD(P)-dependent oxidoreductase [Rhizobium sp. XQZ8]|uniref:SDR family NAD(P)-dependent oxidoreductase n=1 Tax=Rhizobium populisoli TaxID=2859785 RepID=UPI001CA50433|nr:SDR family NAD(P)-dependent oxidoreductase [Rhizobium populisoli]MBW6425656.1 SDR family NAD(P)-dependent oxidoreductase [Rhizobium populisoli]
MASFAETTEGQFDALFNTPCVGCLLPHTDAPATACRRRTHRNFSPGITRVSAAGFSAYSAAKSAVEILTLYMVKELAGRGITANTVVLL